MTKLSVFAKLIRLKRPVDIAKELSIGPSAVFQWRHKGIPANRVLILEEMTGYQLTRYEMRPDVFGVAEA